ncbi:MAG TPA: hypothetical protein VNK49_07995 [Anaerolineales bacterium]|nr:hypothetical protein [Anaerolineales bacterium]
MTTLNVSLDSVTITIGNRTVTLSTPPPQTVQYYRVKHDSQLAEFNFMSRTADPKWGGVGLQTPEVVPLFVQPSLSSGTHRTRVDGAWETIIDALNKNDARKLTYLKADTTALFNTSGFPQLESLTMGGNVLTLEEIQGEWGRVKTLDYNQIPNVAEVNYVSRPDVIHKFVVVGWRQTTRTTYWVNPPVGELYWPLVSSRPLWIPLARLEKFPALPLSVTANVTLNIRKTPEVADNLTGQHLSAGKSATIVEYRPVASSVWGRIENLGWIALLWYPEYKSPPRYFTSWQMETVPPPPGE